MSATAYLGKDWVARRVGVYRAPGEAPVDVAVAVQRRVFLTRWVVLVVFRSAESGIITRASVAEEGRCLFAFNASVEAMRRAATWGMLMDCRPATGEETGYPTRLDAWSRERGGS